MPRIDLAFSEPDGRMKEPEDSACGRDVADPVASLARGLKTNHARPGVPRTDRWCVMAGRFGRS